MYYIVTYFSKTKLCCSFIQRHMQTSYFKSSITSIHILWYFTLYRYNVISRYNSFIVILFHFLILQFHLHFQLDFLVVSSAKQNSLKSNCKIWGIIHAWGTKWWNKDATKAQYFPKVTISDISSFCHSKEKKPWGKSATQVSVLSVAQRRVNSAAQRN